MAVVVFGWGWGDSDVHRAPNRGPTPWWHVFPEHLGTPGSLQAKQNLKGQNQACFKAFRAIKGILDIGFALPPR